MSTAALAALCLGASGACDQPGQSEEEVEQRISEGTAAENYDGRPTTLLEEKIGPTATLRVVEHEPGFVVTEISGDADQDKELRNLGTKTTDPVELFRALHPDTPVPAELTSAVRRSRLRDEMLARAFRQNGSAFPSGGSALPEQAAKGDPAGVTQRSSALTLDDTWDWVADASWFQNEAPTVNGDVGACNEPNFNAWCPGTSAQSQCFLNVTDGHQIRGGLNDLVSFRGTTLAASFDTTAQYRFDYLSCTNYILFKLCNWKTAQNVTIQPRHYQVFSAGRGSYQTYAQSNAGDHPRVDYGQEIEFLAPCP